MATTKASTKQAQQAVNEERIGISEAEMQSLLRSMMPSIDWRRVLAEGIVAFMYGYTLGVVGSYVFGAIMLLSMPAWLNFLVLLFFVATLVSFVMMTASPVATFVCDKGVWAGAQLKAAWKESGEALGKARRRVSDMSADMFAHTTH